MKFKRYKTYLIFGPTSIGKTSSLNKFKDIAETFDYSSFLNKKLDLYNRVLSDSSKKPIVITTHPSTENKSYAILYKINKMDLFFFSPITPIIFGLEKKRMEKKNK